MPRHGQDNIVLELKVAIIFDSPFQPTFVCPL